MMVKGVTVVELVSVISPNLRHSTFKDLKNRICS